MVATWKAGGIMVSINPMNRERELRLLLDDSAARALITPRGALRRGRGRCGAGHRRRHVITTSELDYLDDVPALLEGVQRTRAEGTDDLLELVREHEGERPDPVASAPTTSPS